MRLVENDLDRRVQVLLARIPQEVDRMVTQLKSSLLNPMTHPAAKRGLWDRFKGTLSNFWWGRYNQDNPYFWKNKLGDDLGHAQQEEGIMPVIPIKEYMLFKAHFDKLEEQLNLLSENIPGTENLAIVRIITNWGEQLKQLLTQTVKSHLQGNIDDLDAEETPPAAPTPPSAPSRPVENPDLIAQRKAFAEQAAKQMKDRGDISEDEYQQILTLANSDPTMALKRITEIQKKAKKGTKPEATAEKELLKKRLENLRPGIEEEAYKDVLQKIKDDDLDGAERDIEKYEKAGPAEKTPDSTFNDKKTAVIDALDKAKEKGLPDEKYEIYKKAIDGAVAPDTTTLDRVLADLQRTAVASDPVEDKPTLNPLSGNDDEEDSEEDMGHEYDSSYVSYWDRKPNTTAEWDTLQPSEKLAWNNYGGGIEKRITKGELKNLHLPWILRIGDPRQKKIYNRRKHLWNQLESQGRIESPSNPIDSRQEFEARLKKAKELKKKYIDLVVSRRKRTTDDELAKNQRMDSDPMDDIEPGHDEVGHDPRTEPAADQRTIEAPQDSLPPNLPTGDEEVATTNRTAQMDEPSVDPASNDDKLKEFMAEIDKHKDKLSPNQIEKLTNLAMGTDEEEGNIERAMSKLARIIGRSSGGEVHSFENTVQPYMTRSLSERVEYFKARIRNGNKCVR